MANVWTPEAERLTPSGTSGDLKGGGAKAILHVTVSGSGGTNFDAMHRVLTSKQGEPHYLYDPVTDRLGQYFALNTSSRSLVMGSGPVSCNRAGSRVIQIEVVAWPGTTDGAYKDGAPTTKGGFTSLWKPGPNFRAMMRDIRANGVPDRFPMGSTAPGCPRASFNSYQSGAGWYGHGQIPYQTHWDPGLIDQAAFFAASYTTTPAPQEDLPMAIADDINNKLTTLLGQEAGRYSDLVGRLTSQAAQLGALQGALQALAANPDLTSDEVTAAAKAGAQAALDERITGAAVNLNVTPPPA